MLVRIEIREEMAPEWKCWSNQVQPVFWSTVVGACMFSLSPSETNIKPPMLGRGVSLCIQKNPCGNVPQGQRGRG